MKIKHLQTGFKILITIGIFWYLFNNYSLILNFEFQKFDYLFYAIGIKSLNIFLIAFATFIGFMGGSIIGVSSSILSSKLLPEFEKKNFYDTSSVMMIIPYFLFIPLGSFLLVNSQFKIAFLIASLLLIVFVAPIYLILLISYSKYN